MIGGMGGYDYSIWSLGMSDYCPFKPFSPIMGVFKPCIIAAPYQGALNLPFKPFSPYFQLLPLNCRRWL